MDNLDAKTFDEHVKNTFAIIDNIINNELTTELFLKLIEKLDEIASIASKIQNEAIDLNEYNDKLSSLAEAFQNGDIDLFKDILEFELKPLLDYWKEQFN